MQRDSSTYCDEPSDTADFTAWRETFSLADQEGRIAELVKNNALIGELHARLVPMLVAPEEFWTRYFFKWVSGGWEEGCATESSLCKAHICVCLSVLLSRKAR